MTNQCAETRTSNNFWLSIVLVMVISLMVTAVWSFMHQLIESIPATTDVCTDTSSASTLQRSHVFPLALKER